MSDLDAAVAHDAERHGRLTRRHLADGSSRTVVDDRTSSTASRAWNRESACWERRSGGARC